MGQVLPLPHSLQTFPPSGTGHRPAPSLSWCGSSISMHLLLLQPGWGLAPCMHFVSCPCCSTCMCGEPALDCSSLAAGYAVLLPTAILWRAGSDLLGLATAGWEGQAEQEAMASPTAHGKPWTQPADQLQQHGGGRRRQSCRLQWTGRASFRLLAPSVGTSPLSPILPSLHPAIHLCAVRRWRGCLPGALCCFPSPHDCI